MKPGNLKAEAAAQSPSTPTNSAAVEAANAAATEICDWCGIDSNDAERVSAIISKHFAPTEAAVPAGEAEK